jgi:hypothetical protein
MWTYRLCKCVWFLLRIHRAERTRPAARVSSDAPPRSAGPSSSEEGFSARMAGRVIRLQTTPNLVLQKSPDFLADTYWEKAIPPPRPHSRRSRLGLRAVCCRFRQAACCREPTPQAPNTETFPPSHPAFHPKNPISSLLSLISLPRKPAPFPPPRCLPGAPIFSRPHRPGKQPSSPAAPSPPGRARRPCRAVTGGHKPHRAIPPPPLRSNKSSRHRRNLATQEPHPKISPPSLPCLPFPAIRSIPQKSQRYPILPRACLILRHRHHKQTPHAPAAPNSSQKCGTTIWTPPSLG